MSLDNHLTGPGDPEHHKGSADAAEGVAKQLLAQAQALAELRRDLDRLASDTTDTLTGLSQRLDETETKAQQRDQTPSSAGQAWCWRTAGPRTRETLWTELTDWVDHWLRHRYPLAKKIPPCWGRHPEVVEELTALWLAWQSAYTQADAPLTGPADFHDRWLPGLLHRLDHGAYALNCGTKHQNRPLNAYARHQHEEDPP